MNKLADTWHDVADELPEPNTSDKFLIRKITKLCGKPSVVIETAIYITFDARAFFAGDTHGGEVTHWQRIPKKLLKVSKSEKKSVWYMK